MSQGGPPTAAKKANFSINSSSSNGVSNHLVEKIRTVSQPEMVELSYEYITADLRLLPQKPGECVSSPIFQSKLHPGIQWQLQIYPNGDKDESKSHLSLYLIRICKEEEKGKVVSTHFKMSVLRNGVEKARRTYCLFQPIDKWGWTKFCSLDELNGKDSQFSNDQLKVVCSLVYEAKRNWLTNLDR